MTPDVTSEDKNEHLAELLTSVGAVGVTATVLLGIPAFLLGFVGGIDLLTVGLASLIIGLVGEFWLETPGERYHRLTEGK